VNFTQLGDRYEVGQIIGRGGMAQVHEGTDTRLNRKVAIKILRADLSRDPSFQDRFRREAQAAAGLNHPNVVSVYDTGEEFIGDTKVPYIVMEYVDGVTLQHMLTNGPRILPERSLEITAGILAALDYAHRHGIIHRDIKPANIMINAHGDAKVMDFGIARAISDSITSSTSASAVMGTAKYLSPEQARGEVVDARSDIYAAGCLMYELLTGQAPFTGDSGVVIAYQHVNELATPPSQLDPAISTSLDAIVLKSLAKHPSQRYQTAAEMRADVERAMAGLPVAAVAANSQLINTPTVAVPIDPTVAIPRVQAQPSIATALPSNRNRWILFGTLGIVAVAGIIAIWILFLGKTSVAVQTPSVVGQTVADANKTLTDVKLKLGLQTPQNDPSAPIGTILSQVPAAGTSIKEGESVNVSVSSGAAKTTVPNLIGLVGPDAINKALGDAHLKLGRYPQQDSDTVPAPSPNTVLSQSPAPNSQVDANTTVDIVISSGKIKVPAVLNESKTQANNDLINAGFNVTVIYEDHSDKPDGIVLAQTPAGGQGLAQGSYVTITVSHFVAASPTSTPVPSPTNTHSKTPVPSPTNTHSKTPVPSPSAS
jgi:serine/threonine-protein kinase